jgi:cell fate regulator YaaT (PSP1 superfamily)
MPTVVGVRLRFTKTLWFDPSGTDPKEGDLVVVETERGTEFGTVAHSAQEVDAKDVVATLKPIVRIANEEDLARAAELEALERDAMPVFRELVESHKLDMKPIDVEYLLDGEKIVFYFAAEERVDFRDLVRELATRFKARIDMRQIGVRDEARMVGGLGHCGEMLCCVRLGGEFQPVSIRMAKEQDLPLNPLKISGLCGRLMCCLRYEFEAYKDFKTRAPKRGAVIETPKGLAKVAEMNTPRETITLRFEDGGRVTVPLTSMECSKGSGCPCCVGAQALEEAGAMPMPTIVEPPARERAERPEPVSAEPSDQSVGSGRKRRRRGSQSGEGQAAGETKAAEKPEAPARVPRRSTRIGPAADAEKPPAEGEAKPARSGRRRRRRKPSGGGEASST